MTRTLLQIDELWTQLQRLWWRPTPSEVAPCLFLIGSFGKSYLAEWIKNQAADEPKTQALVDVLGPQGWIQMSENEKSELVEEMQQDQEHFRYLFLASEGFSWTHHLETLRQLQRRVPSNARILVVTNQVTTDLTENHIWNQPNESLESVLIVSCMCISEGSLLPGRYRYCYDLFHA